MLEYLRNAAEKPVAKILIGILAFSFIGWGVAEWIFGNVVSDTTLVRVGNQAVTVQEFNLEKSRMMAQMTREQQRAAYADAAAANALNQQIITKLTTNKMVEAHADDLGFIVSDAKIAREIRQFPEFQAGGQFSTLMFDTILRNSGYSEAEFAEVLRGQVLRSMVLGPLSVSVPVPQFAIDAAYRARYAKRGVEYVPVNFSDFAVANPTDEQLREYYAQNPHVIPETRSVSYVLIPAKMDQPDTYDAAYEQAIKVEDDIIAGDAMDVAAKKHNARHVTIAAFDKDHRPNDAVLSDKMIAKLFDMDAGVESEMIETKQGFVIARVDAINPAHNAEFDTIKNNLIGDWKRDAQRKQAYIRANEILTAIKDGNAPANITRAKVSRTSGASIDVLTAAFANDVGTKTIAQGANGFYVISIVDETAPDADASRTTAMKTEMQTMADRQIMDDYNSFLLRKYPAKFNEKLFNKFFVQ